MQCLQCFYFIYNHPDQTVFKRAVDRVSTVLAVATAIIHGGCKF